MLINSSDKRHRRMMVMNSTNCLLYFIIDGIYVGILSTCIYSPGFLLTRADHQTWRAEELLGIVYKNSLHHCWCQTWQTQGSVEWKWEYKIGGNWILLVDLNRRFPCDDISSKFCKSSYLQPPCWFPVPIGPYWEKQQDVPLLFI